MAKTLALIHTAYVLIPAFVQLCRDMMPEVEVFNIVDESLLRNTMKQGLTDGTKRRLAMYVESAREAGADAVLVTCSSIGPAVAPSREAVDIPVFRIDEAMAEEAVRTGRRIGVAATLRSTLEPTQALLEETAAKQGRKCEIVARLCEGAFEAVTSGDPDTHDRIVSFHLLELMSEVDVIVLAQASMARVAERISPEKRKAPILSSPRLAVQRVKESITPA